MSRDKDSQHPIEQLVGDDQFKAPVSEGPAMPYPGVVRRTGDVVNDPDSEERDLLRFLANEKPVRPPLANAEDVALARQKAKEDTEQNNNTPWPWRKIGSAVGGAALAVGLIASMLNGGDGKDENEVAAITDDTEQPQDLVEPTSPTATEEHTLGGEETPKKEASVIPEGFIDAGDGFIVPETRPGYETTPPTIKETHELSEVLAQQAEIMEYVQNTGDFDYAQYVTDNYEMLEGFRGNYEAKRRIETEMFTPEFYYWINTEPAVNSKTLDPKKDKEVVEVRNALLGFSDDVNSMKESFFGMFTEYEATLEPRRVSVNGEILVLWITTSTSEPTYQRVDDPGDILTNY